MAPSTRPHHPGRQQFESRWGRPLAVWMVLFAAGSALGQAPDAAEPPKLPPPSDDAAASGDETEDAETETTDAEPTDAEPTDAEPTDAEPTQTEPTQTEPTQPPEAEPDVGEADAVWGTLESDAFSSDAGAPPPQGAELDALLFGGEDAEQAAPPADWGDVDGPEAEKFQLNIYGYLDSYWEQVIEVPTADETGKITRRTGSYEFDVLNLHLMFQGAIYEKYRFFLNFAAGSSGSNSYDQLVAVRNAWIEAPLLAGYATLRFGKMYRKFGIYNEQLDAVPTFIGIEPPELFDSDHLMLSRTTNLMLHGSATFHGQHLSYAVTTGDGWNNLRLPSFDDFAIPAIPVGADVRMHLFSSLKVGTSMYWSGGGAAPDLSVGQGSPKTGVQPWMAEDHYGVVGAFAEFDAYGLLLQGAYYFALHQAKRDPVQTALLAEAGLNDRQRERMFRDGAMTEDNVIEDVLYDVQTAYVRAGYELTLFDDMTFTPYGQFDWYRNPETIANKTYGGDNEAGASDDGMFFKVTGGLVVRPVPEVAIKADASAHLYALADRFVYYPEVRLSASYVWGAP